MPLFFQQQLNAHTQLGVWKIEEPESFFQVPLQRSITHPHKRLQHLAGRALLKVLFPFFPVELIQIADTRKPFLENELFHFSISHCSDYAAVVVSTKNRVGVDIEVVDEKISRIQHKFISPGEHLKLKDANQINFITNTAFSNNELTLIWSCKEAVFKWYGAGEVDFKNHMQIQSIHKQEENTFETALLFKKNEDRLLRLQSCFFADVCLSYIIT